jgi:hypothetical protein
MFRDGYTPLGLGKSDNQTIADLDEFGLETANVCGSVNSISPQFT